MHASGFPVIFLIEMPRHRRTEPQWFSSSISSKGRVQPGGNKRKQLNARRATNRVTTETGTLVPGPATLDHNKVKLLYPHLALIFFWGGWGGGRQN